MGELTKEDNISNPGNKTNKQHKKAQSLVIDEKIKPGQS